MSFLILNSRFKYFVPYLIKKTFDCTQLFIGTKVTYGNFAVQRVFFLFVFTIDDVIDVSFLSIQGNSKSYIEFYVFDVLLRYNGYK